MGNLIVGIDEAGRGPLAGRVYAAAVILDPENDILGLKDSKKLSEESRNRLYEEIINKSLSYSIAFSTVGEINNINILNATFLAMNRALKKIKVDFSEVLVDGRDFPFGSEYKGEAIIKGDDKIPSIMAASILAKVTRDNYMKKMDAIYPEYNFVKHKGYPTQEHFELIKKFGPCRIHRKGFRGVKEFL